MIRPAELSDAEYICSIYNEYILNTTHTFEEDPVSTEEMQERMRKITRNYPWLVYEKEGAVIGYTYASRWRKRPAYRFTVEPGIFIDSDHLGEGIGSRLTEALLAELRKRSFHSAVAVIALPNPQSIGLYEKYGFEKVAHFKEVGHKFGRWIDIGNWQLML